jgi:hypothetical protein
MDIDFVICTEIQTRNKMNNVSCIYIPGKYNVVYKINFRYHILEKFTTI